jgi:small-conductance mechanosensitive channel/CRP-like cAMP-binding protein
MKSARFGIVSSVVVLVFLTILRIPGAGIIRAAIAAPYAERFLSALGVLMVVAGAFVLDRLVRYFYWDGYLRRQRKKETPALIEDILTVALVVLGISLGLFFEAGVSFTGLITASGATAVVLGIALQAVINDVFSGLSLNLDGSYGLGDWLTVYSDQFPEPIYGRVEGITWRSTFLCLTDGRSMMVPNHLMTSNPVLNHCRPPGPKRLSVDIPVANRYPPDRAMSILLGEAYRALREEPRFQGGEPTVLITKIDSDTTFFQVRFYSNPDQINPEVARSTMAMVLHRGVLRNKVPNPVTQVELVPSSEDADYDSSEARIALHHAAIFKDVLDAGQIDALVSACHARTLPSNMVFIRQGAAGSSMFILLEGAARVSVDQENGERRDVAVLTSGDIVGEMSLMTGAPRTATVTSLTALRVLEVTKESIEKLLTATPGLLERIGHVLAIRQSALNELAAIPNLKSAAEPDILARMRKFFSLAFR